MKDVEAIHSYGNSASPHGCSATLTQFARTLKRSPAWIRHHLLVLEAADLIEVGEIRKTGKINYEV